MALKFQALVDLYEDGKTSLRRFPLTVVIAILGTTIALIMSFEAVSLDKQATQQLARTILTLIAAFPLSIVTKLLQERYSWNARQATIGYGALFIIISSFYLLIPSDLEQARQWEMLRIVILIAVSFLSVGYIPYLITEEKNGFWQFGKSLVARVFFSGVFSGVLFLGATMILKSINFLFDIPIQGEYVFRIWIFCVGIVATLFFLGGVPKNLPSLNKEKTQSELLRKFITFILVPLLGIYTLVLYTYGIKILITGTWPSSQTIDLIAGYVISGLITYAISYPLQEKNPRASTVGKIWLWLLIPILVLYFAAIHLRVNQYGITEDRYFVVMLGVFYTITAIYLLASKKKNIILIPLIFSVLAVIGNIGPASAYSVSVWSQTNHLEKLLIADHLLENGKLVKKPADKNIEDESEIEGIINYIVAQHGTASIEKWLPESLKKDADSANTYSREKPIVIYLFGESADFNFTPQKMSESTQIYFNAKTAANHYQSPINIAGYDTMASLQTGEPALPVIINGVEYTTWITNDGLIMVKGSTTVVHRNILGELKKFTLYSQEVDPDKLTFSGEENGIKYKIFFSTLSLNNSKSNAPFIENSVATLLIKKL